MELIIKIHRCCLMQERKPSKSAALDAGIPTAWDLVQVEETKTKCTSVPLKPDVLGGFPGESCDKRTRGRSVMKFVSFKSRGGDYLVVAQNVAWLRSHEDGQTKIGIIGSESIQVAGTIEETAATILAG